MFRVAVHSRFTTFKVIMSHFQFGVQSHFSSSCRSESSSSLFSFDVPSHHRLFSVRLLEPSLVFRSTFRVASSVSAFRAIITFRFRRSEPSSCFQFGVQSHHHFLVSAFRAITALSVRHSEPSSLFSFGVQSHHRVFSSAFRAIIGFQIDIQSRILDFDVQSRYHFSV